VYCLDSNILIDFLRGDPKITAKIKGCIKTNQILYTTPIILCELYKGAFMSSKPDEAVTLINQLMVDIKLLDFNEQACYIFGKLFKDLQNKGKPTQIPDLMIGSITKAYSLILITRNKKDFTNISNLKIEVW